MIYRGTTPTLAIQLYPLHVSQIASYYLTIQQGSNVVEKTEADGTAHAADNIITIRLTQDETLMFEPKKEASMQIRGKTTDGTVFATSIITKKFGAILKEGEI